MIAIGLVGFGALWALDRAYDLAPASLVAPYAYSLPIWITLERFLFMGSRPHAFTFFGSVIITGSQTDKLLLLKGLQSANQLPCSCLVLA